MIIEKLKYSVYLTNTVHDKCGVVGISSSRPVASDLYYALRALQHRGQESAGIVTFDKSVYCVKEMGPVHEVFDTKRVRELRGNVGIAHVRYPTAGESGIESAQPIHVSSAVGELAVAHNGDLVNSKMIRKELQREGYAFTTATDAEVIVRLLAKEISKNKSPIGSLRNVMKKIRGAYSLAILVGGHVFGLRDPWGVKPLCLGKTSEGYVIASESVALDAIGAELVRDVFPGELIELKDTSFRSYKTFKSKNTAHCMFEYVYFARPDAIIDGKSVYEVRVKIGERLAREKPVDADVVCSVPDSGTTYALGFSKALGLPFAEGLIKNRYVWRSFILPDQRQRDLSVREKLNPVKPIVSGKRVVLLDDSIVRGTTMKRIVQLVRRTGAKEVHVRIGSSPIIAPCYLGIDMRTRDQFAAAKKSVELVRRTIGADSLGYVSIEGLVASIGHKAENLCLGCLTEEYPIKIPGEKLRTQEKLVI